MGTLANSIQARNKIREIETFLGLWKPKIGEKFFICTKGGVCQNEWNDCAVDLMAYAVGNCFKTQEEAKAHSKEILELLQKIYDGGKPLIGAN